MSHDPRPSLADLRAQIDDLDHRIIDLLAQRMQVVTQLSGVKRAEGLRVRDPARERAVLEDRTREAAKHGLSRELIESTFRVIMRASREYQAALKDEDGVALDGALKTVESFLH